jgi:hypothetical protein
MSSWYARKCKFGFGDLDNRKEISIIKLVFVFFVSSNFDVMC